MEKTSGLYILILAGGGGTRLWPLSREKSPKQFLKLFQNKSLFELTLERALKVVPLENILVITSHAQVDFIKQQSKLPAENILVEPMRRDTALAMGIGTMAIYKRDPNAAVINMPCDHLVRPESTFVREITSAAKFAQTNKSFVVMGIHPRFIHTGYGHVKTNGKKDEMGFMKGLKFIEKPPFEKAKRYTESGNYFWNAGQYIWSAEKFLELMKKHAPKTYVNLPKYKEAIGTSREKEVMQMTYQMAPTVSIDYAVSEKLTSFYCYPATYFWTDVGDWSEVYNNLDKDSQGNVVFAYKGQDKFIGLNSKNNLFMLDKQMIVAVGIENLMVVDTPDALLICKADDDQAVKEVVKRLKDENMTDYL